MPSLADRAGRALRGLRRRQRATPPLVADPDELVLQRPIPPAWVGWAVAALITAGPLLTAAGAEALAGRARADTKILDEAAAPRRAAAVRAGEARAILRGAIVAPALGATLDALAVALPEGDRLAAIATDGTGALAVDIATVDPDRLRAALRRSRLGGLAEAGQQRGDGVLLVRWAGRPG